MPKINQYDALTGLNDEIEITEQELAEIVGDVTPTKSIDEVMSEKQVLKNAAIAKLAALGLTEDEAKAIIG